jgi:hypothetical protein
MLSKAIFALFLPLITLQAVTSAHGHATSTIAIANVTLPDTRLIRAAQSLAKKTLTEVTYNHVMRCWIFAAILQRNLPSAFGTVDKEALAIAALLHDLGLDNSTFVSADKRFEVDGAIGARNWLVQQQTAGLTEGWDESRLQLVWDAIALHAEPSFSQHKQPLVALTSNYSAGEESRLPRYFSFGLQVESYAGTGAQRKRLDQVEPTRPRSLPSPPSCKLTYL